MIPFWSQNQLIPCLLIISHSSAGALCVLRSGTRTKGWPPYSAGFLKLFWLFQKWSLTIPEYAAGFGDLGNHVFRWNSQTLKEKNRSFSAKSKKCKVLLVENYPWIRIARRGIRTGGSAGSPSQPRYPWIAGPLPATRRRRKE